MKSFISFLKPKTIEDRPTWSHRFDIFFTMLSNGTGYTCFFATSLFYRSGSAIFLPLIVTIVLLGFPINFLQVTVGQLTRRSSLESWEILCPALKGLGYGCLIFCIVTSWFNQQIMGYSIFYFMAALRSNSSELPWLTCKNPWNTKDCRCACPTQVTTTTPSPSDYSYRTFDNRTVSSQEYWLYRVNKEIPGRLSDSFSPEGPFNWLLVLSSLFGWSLTLLCVATGIRVIGKVAYILVLLPLLVAIILIIVLSQQSGAALGLKYMFLPDFRRLPSLVDYGHLLSRILYLFRIPSASMVTLASYNNFSRRSFFDCLGLTIFVSISLILFNATMFMTQGILAYHMHQDLSQLFSHGFNALFKTIPSGLGILSNGGLWTALFFFMFFCCNLSATICFRENAVSSILDIIGSHKWWKRVIVSCIFSFVDLIIIFLTSTRTSRHIHVLIDLHIATLFSAFVLYLFTIAAVYNFGSHRIVSFIGVMSNIVCCSKFLRRMWKYFSIFTFFIMVLAASQMIAYRFSFIFPTTHYSGSNSDSSWSYIHTSNFIMVLPFLPIPLLLVLQFMRGSGSPTERCRNLIRPQWMPDQIKRIKYTHQSWIMSGQPNGNV